MILQHGLISLGRRVLSLSFLLCGDVVLRHVPLLRRLLSSGTQRGIAHRLLLGYYRGVVDCVIHAGVVSLGWLRTVLGGSRVAHGGDHYILYILID